jgi:glycosyltransferase involved in cell wall biosynthesis
MNPNSPDAHIDLDRLRASDSWERAYSESEPLVTVRIATWNRAELLVERALASVRRQTYSNWEAVVVGDCCTDDTEERVRGLGDPRIRFRDLPVHGPYPEDRVQRWMIAGVPAMNAGLRMVRGSWIAPLDDDDEWDDDHIEVLLSTVRERQAEVVYGRVRGYLDGVPADHEIGAWPPRSGEIDLAGVLYHAGLRVFEHDLGARFLNEVNDWNLMRRMWEAGVRFTFLDRVVGTYHMDHFRGVMRHFRETMDASRGQGV